MAKPTPSNLPIETPVMDNADEAPGLVTRWAKIVWLSFWLMVATLLVFPPITLVSLFSKTGNSMFQLARMWAWLILKVTGVRVVVRGAEKIDRSRAYMIIANHQSHFDGPALAWGLGGLQFRWIAKRELLRIPLFGHCLNSSRNIFIDRTNRESAIASIQEGMLMLPPGAGVMCFAEGTRSATGRIGAFKKGGFAAALHNGMPCCPLPSTAATTCCPKAAWFFAKALLNWPSGIPSKRPAKTPGISKTWSRPPAR